jgi:hypothetical protein
MLSAKSAAPIVRATIGNSARLEAIDAAPEAIESRIPSRKRAKPWWRTALGSAKVCAVTAGQLLIF